ncbi:hypothetical protein P691DRAFT_433425 [Macrolepiota fuliginosa MF-IS2]|uniref:Uncharacterized protein n=1 Tax=Macrolepiota fuliginosa MF-IS2 TaxID=1400762 RepID=A0A9P6C431_9AGAR|nr:hypothetical protein P691DRAFT_433425 [Macrolepiota fuliginosa MF-IS2]
MPSLSFIKPKAHKWKAMVSNRTPFPVGRFDSISSPHPYASPDIIDVQDNSISSESIAELPAPPGPSIPQSPNLKIDVDLSYEPFDSDWFQTRFTSVSSPSLGQQHNGNRGEATRAVIQEGRSMGLAERWEPQGVPTEVPTDDDDDIDLSTSEDDVLNHLQTMDVSVRLHHIEF